MVLASNQTLAAIHPCGYWLVDWFVTSGVSLEQSLPLMTLHLLSLLLLLF
jgi:hypothetical protein